MFCKRCGQEKDVSEFRTYQKHCIACDRKKSYDRALRLGKIKNPGDRANRNEKGQYLVTTGAKRYKTVQRNGVEMQRSRAAWIENFGEIPDGFQIHHINHNKKDDRIENLSCISGADHVRLHAPDRKIWNKGLSKEDSRIRDLMEKVHLKRNKTFLNKNKIKYEFIQSGKTLREGSVFFGISYEHMCKSVKKYREYLLSAGLIQDTPRCSLCEKKLFRNNLCRWHYERQNPNSKFYKQYF